MLYLILFLFKSFWGFCHFFDRGEMTRIMGRKTDMNLCLPYKRLEHISSFLVFFPLSQYIFTCLHGGITPHLTMVHHSVIVKYQEEQGGLSNQVSRTRAQSKPPPLPLKRVRRHFYTGTRSAINRATTCHVSLIACVVDFNLCELDLQCDILTIIYPW